MAYITCELCDFKTARETIGTAQTEIHHVCIDCLLSIDSASSIERADIHNKRGLAHQQYEKICKELENESSQIQIKTFKRLKCYSD